MLQQQGSQLFLIQLDELLLLVLITVDILALTHALSVVHHVIAGLIVHLITIHVIFILFCLNHHLVLTLMHLVIHLILAVIVLITIIVLLSISVFASLLILVHLLLIIVVLVLLVDHLLLGVVVLLISRITHFLAAVFFHLNLAGLLRIDLRFVVLREVGCRSIKLIVVVGRDQKLPLFIRKVLIGIHAGFPQDRNIPLQFFNLIQVVNEGFGDLLDQEGTIGNIELDLGFYLVV